MKGMRSISGKLLALVTLATLSALMVAGGVFLYYDIRSYRDLRSNDMSTQIALLGYSAVPALQFEDEQVARENLDLLRFRPSVEAAAIYNSRGNLFAGYTRAGSGHAFPSLPGEDGINPEGDALVIFSRIIEDGEILGTAYLRADYLVTERILQYLRVFSLIALGAMGVATLFTLWLQSLISGPVRAIAGIAREVVERKDYGKRATRTTDDEVGVLVDAFNGMLQEIEQRTQALEKSNHDLENEIAEGTRSRELIQLLNEELEHKVQERTSQLQATNQELESFCFSVSHDLRGPLRSINGFTQALVEELPGELPGDSRRYLDKIIAASHRMGQLIEDLLNLSRVSRGELHRQRVDLSELSRLVVQDLHTHDPAYSVQVSIWDGLEAEGDPKLIRILLENLLGNAWKFTSRTERPQIAVGLMKDGEREVFFVRDNGAGFDMKYADKLFGAFQRLHAMHEFPGTGIGLATVQRIINRHGGRVWCDSAPGEGAVFYFTLKLDPGLGRNGIAGAQCEETPVRNW